MPPTATATEPRTTHLEDYRPPTYLADTVELLFELDEEHTLVTSTVIYRLNPEAVGDDRRLVLDGTDLDLVAVKLDGHELGDEDVVQDGRSLTLGPGEESFALQVITRLKPQENTTLEGLYRSGGTYCTQMEAQGFRRVTYYQDRPDVLAEYTCTVVADKQRFPTLLSNGNLVDAGDAEDGKHYTTWHDPHLKPCYLFALVAGDLACRESTFTTVSGREVQLKLFVDRGNEDRTAHAMESLERSMRWDEVAFGREYDLDVFMVVAVSDFNMGAMENKGLNLFNDQLVLARPETATDEDYHRIEGVIGHEYFHNWSGNRVTCRDWFQLSLKEGLTVFRDQEFSADMGQRAVQRIADVRHLRSTQFPEDAGPLAHPVRPRSFITIDNFYTTTIYEKGAEVIRMLHALLGAERFREACDLYFDRHDGQAVTTEDFVKCMEDASGLDLTRFRLWYEQAGTPVLKAEGRYDAEAGVYELVLEQSCPPTPGQPTKEPFLIPVRVGLLGSDGQDLPLRLEGEAADGPAPTTRVLPMRRQREVFRFTGLEAAPVPSLVRGYSAPVVLDQASSRDALSFQAAHDSDLFNRWEAIQRLAIDVILSQVDDQRAGREPAAPQELDTLFGRLLDDDSLDPAFLAEALDLPDEAVLGDRSAEVDVDAIHAARTFTTTALARSHRDALRATFDRLADAADGPWSVETAGARALRNLCLGYLVQLDEPELLQLAVAQSEQPRTMTEELAALKLLANREDALRDEAVARFRERWHDDPLVMNKWFVAQAASSRSQTVDDVIALADDPAFDATNPNKLRALYRTLARNPLRFHGADGRGYRLLADVVLAVDTRNPVLAGRLAAVFNGWKRHEPGRRALQEQELKRILGTEGISENVQEITGKALA